MCKEQLHIGLYRLWPGRWGVVTLIVRGMLVTITWVDKHPLITDYFSLTRLPYSDFNLNSLVWSGDFFFSLLAGNYSATLLLHLFVDPLLNC